MWVVASTALLLAATPTLPLDGPPQPDVSSAFTSAEALRHYAQGRLLEERGEGSDALNEFYRAMLLDRRSASLARRVSELSARLGDSQRSLEFAERSLTLEPHDARGLWLKGTALFNLGRAGESIEFLDSAARADSDQVEYARTLARVAEQLDRVDVVQRAYTRIVELDEDDGEAWFQLAAAQARRREFGAAERSLGRATELNPARPGMYFLEGRVREALGQTPEAIRLYQGHLGIHPDDQATRRRLVNLLARQKRYGEAHREAHLVAAAAPDDIDALEVETDLAFRASHARRALELLERMKSQADDDPEVGSRVVSVMAGNGRGRAAVALADAWASAHPADYRGPMLAAQARSLVGQHERAVELARRALDMSPDSLAPRALLGRLHQGSRRYREAEEVWSEAARRFPNRLDLSFNLAYCREQQGNIEGAQQAARDALKLEPNNPTALNFLGYLLADHDRDLGEAGELIRQALDLDPDNGAYVDSLGWLFYRVGRLADAREQLERAVGLTGGDPVVHEHLGDVYKDLQLFDLARDQYRKSMAGGGSSPRLKAKLAGIR